MTVEKIRELGERAMADAISQLTKTGEVRMMFHLVKRDGGVDHVVFDQKATNDPAFKRQFGDMVRARVAAGEIVATLLVSDTFTTHDDIESPKIQALRRAFGLELKDLGDMGICKVKEAIALHLESPLLTETRHQEYVRKEGRIELDGPEIIAEGHSLRGRVSGFFTQEARHA
jgi:hypothetical protein